MLGWLLLVLWDLLLVLVVWEWEKEVKSTVVLGFVLSLLFLVMNWNLVDLVVWVWLEELMNFLLEFLNWLNKVWPSHLELIHLCVWDRFIEISHFVVESSLLNVSSSDRFVPLVVKSIYISGNLSNIDEESVDLSHLLHVSVALIINDKEEFEEVEEGSEELYGIIVDSVFLTGLEHALFWVFEAPVLHIITNSLELTLFSVLEDGINDSINGSLNLIKVDGPDIIMHLSLDTPSGGESWLSPFTKALSRYDISIRLIESLKESTIDFSRVLCWLQCG